MSEILCYPDADTLSRAVADRFIDRLIDIQRTGDVPAIALTGGTIAVRIYQEVARSPRHAAVDWTSIDFYWGDERFVAGDSDERNAAAARTALLSVVGAAEERIHEMPSTDDGADVAAAARAYGDTVRSHGRGAFDLVLFGLGEDGHIASLFPGSAQLDVDDRIAVAVEDAPKPPPQRISLTYPALNRSHAVWFIASGLPKAAAVAASLAGGALRNVPATGVRGAAETCWFLDDPAASRLPTPPEHAVQ